MHALKHVGMWDTTACRQVNARTEGNLAKSFLYDGQMKNNWHLSRVKELELIAEVELLKAILDY